MGGPERTGSHREDQIEPTDDPERHRCPARHVRRRLRGPPPRQQRRARRPEDQELAAEDGDIELAHRGAAHPPARRLRSARHRGPRLDGRHHEGRGHREHRRARGFAPVRRGQRGALRVHRAGHARRALAGRPARWSAAAERARLPPPPAGLGHGDGAGHRHAGRRPAVGAPARRRDRDRADGRAAGRSRRQRRAREGAAAFGRVRRAPGASSSSPGSARTASLANRDRAYTAPVGPQYWVPTGGASATTRPSEPFFGETRPQAMARASSCLPGGPAGLLGAAQLAALPGGAAGAPTGASADHRAELHRPLLGRRQRHPRHARPLDDHRPPDGRRQLARAHGRGVRHHGRHPGRRLRLLLERQVPLCPPAPGDVHPPGHRSGLDPAAALSAAPAAHLRPRLLRRRRRRGADRRCSAAAPSPTRPTPPASAPAPSTASAPPPRRPPPRACTPATTSPRAARRVWVRANVRPAPSSSACPCGRPTAAATTEADQASGSGPGRARSP